MLHVFGVFAGPCMPVVPGVPRVAVVTCVLAVPRVSVGLGGSVVYSMLCLFCHVCLVLHVIENPQRHTHAAPHANNHLQYSNKRTTRIMHNKSM